MANLHSEIRSKKRPPDSETNYIPLELPEALKQPPNDSSVPNDEDEEKNEEMATYNRYKAMMNRGDTTILKLLEKEVEELHIKMGRTVKLLEDLKKIAEENANTKKKGEEKIEIERQMTVSGVVGKCKRKIISDLQEQLQPGEPFLDLLEREIRNLEMREKSEKEIRKLKRLYELKEMVKDGRIQEVIGTQKIEKEKTKEEQNQISKEDNRIKQEPLDFSAEMEKVSEYDKLTGKKIKCEKRDSDDGTETAKSSNEDLQRQIKIEGKEIIDAKTNKGEEKKTRKVPLRQIKREKLDSDENAGTTKPSNEDLPSQKSPRTNDVDKSERIGQIKAWDRVTINDAEEKKKERKIPLRERVMNGDKTALELLETVLKKMETKISKLKQRKQFCKSKRKKSKLNMLQQWKRYLNGVEDKPKIKAEKKERKLPLKQRVMSGDKTALELLEIRIEKAKAKIERNPMANRKKRRLNVLQKWKKFLIEDDGKIMEMVNNGQIQETIKTQKIKKEKLEEEQHQIKQEPLDSFAEVEEVPKYDELTVNHIKREKLDSYEDTAEKVNSGDKPALNSEEDAKRRSERLTERIERKKVKGQAKHQNKKRRQ